MCPDDHDFGPYGKGIEGYILYQQSVDDAHSDEPSGRRSGCGWKWWTAICIIVIVLDTIFKCS